MKAPGVGGVVAEVLLALGAGFFASLAAVFENRFRGVPEHAGDQAWSKHIIQLMKKKGDSTRSRGADRSRPRLPSRSYARLA
eukprot:692401-Pyramimonas_sp.AAC.1